MPETTSTHKPKIFLSHASEDKPFVRRLEAALEAAGVEVWVDPNDLHAGEVFPRRDPIGNEHRRRARSANAQCRESHVVRGRGAGAHERGAR